MTSHRAQHRATTSSPLAGGRLRVALATVLLIPACFSASTAGETDGLALAVENLRPLIEAECAWRFSCCEPGEQVWTFGFAVTNESECVDQIITVLAAGQGHEAVSSGPPSRLLELAQGFNQAAIVPRPDAIEACAATMRARVCNAYLEPDPAGRCLPGEVEVNDPCTIERLFEGQVPPGGECQFGADYSCAEGRCANLGLTLSTCTKTSSVGELCAQDQDCDTGLYCDAVDGHCATGAQLGETCAYLDPSDPLPGTELINCAEGLECDPLNARCVATCSGGALCAVDQQCPTDLVCAVNRCRAPGDSGDPCGKSTDCASGRCDAVSAICLDLREIGELCTAHTDCESQLCNQALLACEAQRKPGEACETGANQMCEDGFCYWDAFAEPSAYSCRAFLDAGEACDDVELRCNNQLEPFLLCINETCAEFPLADGTQCTNAGECASGICFEQECDPGASVGSECDDLGSTRPCRPDLICDRLDGAFQGTCTQRLRTGQICEDNTQCWGSCTVRWSARMCDNTLPASLEEAICDGAPLPPLTPIG